MKYLFTLLSFCICSSLAISQVQLDLLNNEAFMMEGMDIFSNLNPNIKELLQDPTQMDFLNVPSYAPFNNEANKTTKRTVLTMDSIIFDRYEKEEGQLLGQWGQVEPLRRTRMFRYDDNGSSIYNELKNFHYSEKNYDENNNLVEVNAFVWNDSLNEYFLGVNVEYIYDSEKLIQYRYNEIDPETNEQTLSATYDYDYYNDSQLKTVSHNYFHNFDELALSHKGFFEYDNIGRVIQKVLKSIYNQSPDTIKYESRTIVKYANETDNIVDSLKTFYEQDLVQYATFKYDERDRLIEINKFIVEDLEPRLDQSYTWNYNEKDQIIEMIRYIDYGTPSFFDSYRKLVLTYDNSNSISEVHNAYMLHELTQYSLHLPINKDILRIEENRQQYKLDKIDYYSRDELTEDWHLGQTSQWHYSEKEIITIEPDVNPEFSIFPNPVSNFIIVNYGECEWQGEAEIFNLKGHLQKSASISSDNNFVSLKDLSIGTYVLKVRSSDGKILTTKIVKN